MFARPEELTSGCVCFGIVIYRLFMVSRRDEAHNRPFDGGGFQCARLKLSRPRMSRQPVTAAGVVATEA